MELVDFVLQGKTHLDSCQKQFYFRLAERAFLSDGGNAPAAIALEKPWTTENARMHLVVS